MAKDTAVLMMGNPAPTDDSDEYVPWEPPDIPSQQSTQVSSRLGLCPYEDWDPDPEYNEDPPIYLHYGIEWKVAVNNRAIMSKDTEQDLVLEPAAHWEHILEPKLKKALLKTNRALASDATTVVVSVTDRKVQYTYVLMLDSCYHH